MTNSLQGRNLMVEDHGGANSLNSWQPERRALESVAEEWTRDHG